ncbi:MAG: hypothetical protein ACRDRB_20760 [Pseudonocardiaceae bacterium]
MSGADTHLTTTDLPTDPSFDADPIAPHSAQFPLGRVGGAPAHSRPSESSVRPWGLRGMRPTRHQGDPIGEMFGYDHNAQVAVDADGRCLLAADPSANKVSSNDGDEGPSEDFTYDFCPDSPHPV